jgi:hypothetical protein
MRLWRFAILLWIIFLKNLNKKNKKNESNQIKSFGLTVLLVGLLLGGCVTEDDVIIDEAKSQESLSLSRNELNQVEIAKEFSQVLGEVLEGKESRIELAQLIEQVDPFGDAVTLSAILGNTVTMAPSEFKVFSKLDPLLRKRVSHLSETLIDHSLANLSKYKLIRKSFDLYMLAAARQNANISTRDALKEFYSAQGLMVHIPYEEKFDWNSYDNIITTTYDPIVRNDWNEGFIYNNSNGRIIGLDGQVIPMVNDDYSFENPTFVVIYFYEDDMMATPPEPTLPTPMANSVVLDYNVNHTSISQADILFSTIPEMKLTKNDYVGLFGRYTKVRLYRGTNTLKVNFDGTIGSSAEGAKYRYDEIRFTKDDARYERWKTVNIQFDPDWDMSENSQQLILFTEHNLTATAKAKVAAKVGYDFVTKKPTAEFTTSVDVEVTLGGATFQTNSELSRRSVLAHIIGDTGLGTRTRNGIDFNVKGVGLLEFYFEHRFTDILPD